MLSLNVKPADWHFGCSERHTLLIYLQLLLVQWLRITLSSMLLPPTAQEVQLSG